jgi:outer membrane receptor protein involved in Fe transport
MEVNIIFKKFYSRIVTTVQGENMSRAKILVLASLMLTLLAIDLGPLSGALLAQHAESDNVLEPIDIRGTIRREELQTTSATVLENKDLVDRPYYMPVEMLKRVPGVYLGFYGESGIGAEIRVRGFYGGHGGGDVGMYMDGIPIHDNGHGTGYIDTSMLMPIEIESVEVIKGPASVYYGQHGAGASIPFQSIKRGNLTRLELRYGSYNDMTVSGILGRESGKLAQVYAFELYHSDGYRARSRWDRKNLSARWTYQFTDAFSVSLNLRAFQAEWDSAGYISRLKHLDNIYAAADDGSGEGNGGDRERYDARLWAEYLINRDSQLTFYIFGTDLKNRRIMLSEPLLVPNPRLTGSDAFNHHKSWGTGLTYSYHGELMGKHATAALGVSYSYEKEDPKESWTLNWGNGRRHSTVKPGSSTTMDISNPAIFGEVTWQVLDQLNVRLGGRYESLSGTYKTLGSKTNLNTPDVVSNSPTYSFFSPKIGILYTPLDWVQIYANFGRGFSAPGMSASAANGFYADNPFELLVRDQFELGTRLAITDWFDFELALFRIDTKNDSAYDEVAQANRPIGSTKRQGFEASVDIRPFDNWYFNANYSFIDARQKVYRNPTKDYSGLMLTGNMPRHTTNVEIGYAPPIGFGMRASFHWEAYRYLRDEPGTLISGAPNPMSPLRVKDQDNGTLDMQLSWRFNDTYRLALDVKNVLGKEYYGTGYPDYATAAPGTDYLFTPRPPRTFFLTLQMNWDKD